MSAVDRATADAFATSWNHIGSVYTREQFLDWFAPLDPASFQGKEVIELGFGNGSQLALMGTYRLARLAGVELGNTAEQTRKNLAHVDPAILDLRNGDLTTANVGEFDLAYCIGVLHHLKNPRAGFDALLRHTRPGGHFHAWVYAHEGNGLVRAIVEPVRKVAPRLPWWLSKYFLAMPLVAPYYLYAKLARFVPRITRKLPLGAYTLWIARERFRFFHHVAFDQIVTPQTAYMRRSTIEEWLRDERIDPSSTYIVFRNENSWKFGGKRRV